MRSTLLALVFALPAALSAQIMVDPPRPFPCPIPPCRRDQPCPMIACGIREEAVVRQSGDVRVELVDRVLRYEVTETFINRGNRVGEADFMFPLPKNAALQDLKLSINGEMVGGETMSSDQARRIYEQIVRQRRDPALLEWMGYGLLRARIFPINPGEEKKVVIRFQAVAQREGDALRIDYFRGLGNATTTNFVLQYPNDGRYGVAYSPTHSLHNSDEGRTRRAEVRGAAGEMTVLIPVRASNAPSISLLANAPGNEDGFALITLSPPAQSRRAVHVIPRDVTFVLDVSGSMSGKKIEQAREAGKQLIHSLSVSDRFRLIDFSSDVRTFRDGWTTATADNVKSAERYLDDLTAEGGTNIFGALNEALAPPVQAGRLPIILFLTDGLPTVGQTSPELIVRNIAGRRGERRIFSFGVGSDLNISLVEQLALQGGGTVSFVRPDESVERAVSIVASRLTNPLVTDVRVTADGVQLRKMHPAGRVDVFAGEDLVLLARYHGSGSSTLRFEGTTVDGPVSWTAPVSFPERSRDNSFIPRLWATQRVGFLSAMGRNQRAPREVIEEIRDLGERFGIPTEFTSYLVVEPGMQPQALARRGVGSSPNQLEPQVVTGVATSAAASPPPASATQAFDAAKRASELRAARNTAALDSSISANTPRTVARAGKYTFTLRDSVWTDARKVEGPVLRVKAFSEAYFKLIELVSDLRDAFTVGNRVRVSGRAMSIEVSPLGSERLGDSDVAMIKRLW